MNIKLTWYLCLQTVLSMSACIDHKQVQMDYVLFTPPPAASGSSDDGGTWSISAYPSTPSLTGTLLYVASALYCAFVFLAWAWLADPQVGASHPEP